MPYKKCHTFPRYPRGRPYFLFTSLSVKPFVFFSPSPKLEDLSQLFLQLLNLLKAMPTNSTSSLKRGTCSLAGVRTGPYTKQIAACEIHRCSTAGWPPATAAQALVSSREERASRT